MSGKQNEIIKTLGKSKINQDICLVAACREFKFVRARTQHMYVCECVNRKFADLTKTKSNFSQGKQLFCLCR